MYTWVDKYICIVLDHITCNGYFVQMLDLKQFGYFLLVYEYKILCQMLCSLFLVNMHDEKEQKEAIIQSIW